MDQFVSEKQCIFPYYLSLLTGHQQERHWRHYWRSWGSVGYPLGKSLDRCFSKWIDEGIGSSWKLNIFQARHLATEVNSIWRVVISSNHIINRNQSCVNLKSKRSNLDLQKEIATYTYSRLCVGSVTRGFSTKLPLINQRNDIQPAPSKAVMRLDSSFFPISWPRHLLQLSRTLAVWKTACFKTVA